MRTWSGIVISIWAIGGLRMLVIGSVAGMWERPVWKASFLRGSMPAILDHKQ